MTRFALRKFCCRPAFALFVFFADTINAQVGFCPPNMDFEYGDFRSWDCQTGEVSVVGGRNVITWTGTGQVSGQHTIISSASALVDPYGLFTQSCPNGSNYSVMLGNNAIGRGAEKITYTYTIPSTLPAFSMMFHYAVVLQNPSHSTEEQPRFRCTITDLSTSSPLPCANFDFAASGGLPGFRPSPVNSTVIYKDWTPVTLNLNSYIGRTIQLEFITSDCTLGGHFGYAYVDVNSNCNGAITGTTLCQGDNSLSLTAPYGFQAYEWYSDMSFTTLLATTQTLPLNPAPAIGTIYPIIVFPFPGYGCLDTLYATISVSPKPVSFAGNDTGICKYQVAQLGRSPTAGYMYSWSPASFVSDPLISNPTTLPGSSLAPAEYIVKTTDILTGCFSFDTVIVSGISIDTAIQLTGNDAFCNGRAEALINLNNTTGSPQWYNNTSVIAGAVSTSLQPALSGIYWAEIAERGCRDSTRSITITVNPLPRAAFSINDDTLCVTNNLFVFTNTSSVADNSPISYNWKFSDGASQQVVNANKSFTATGAYNTELVATTAFGCKDSASATVYVLPNGIPDFRWDSVCTDRPVEFRNLSNENGSALVQYSWNFNNGGPGSNIKNPPPVIYTTKGDVDVTLQITTLGCETDPKSKTQTLTVNKPVTGIRYKNITVPEGEIWPIKVRDTVGHTYVWKPQTQLTTYSGPHAVFSASGADVQYLIDITGTNTCTTTDTLLMQVLKKPGHYLPTAFTPNGDGLNDLAIPYLVGMQSLKSFSVFNRWGNRVFYSETYRQGWDGKYKGVEQSAGVYVWTLEYYDLNNKLISAKGTITVIR
jgi:gliding motility-associated-like protein